MKAVKGTCPKKRIASKSTESTMPMVVKIATSELTMRNTMTARSTWLRARSSGRMRRQPFPTPPAASEMATTAERGSTDVLERRVAFRGARYGGIHLGRDDVAADEVLDVVEQQAELLLGEVAQLGRQLGDDETGDDAGLEG